MKKFKRLIHKLKWYYLAFLIWIVNILLVFLIITFPILVYLINNYPWFEHPFESAFYETMGE